MGQITEQNMGLGQIKAPKETKLEELLNLSIQQNCNLEELLNRLNSISIKFNDINLNNEKVNKPYQGEQVETQEPSLLDKLSESRRKTQGLQEDLSFVISNLEELI